MRTVLSRVDETSGSIARYEAGTRIDLSQCRRHSVELRLSWRRQERWQSQPDIFRRDLGLAIEAVLRQQMHTASAEVTSFNRPVIQELSLPAQGPGQGVWHLLIGNE